MNINKELTSKEEQNYIFFEALKDDILNREIDKKIINGKYPKDIEQIILENL
jgi:hypothetical protein